METIRDILQGHDACATLALGLLLTFFARPLLATRPGVWRAGAAVWFVAALVDFGYLCDQNRPTRAGEVFPLAVTAVVVGFLAGAISWNLLGALAFAGDRLFGTPEERQQRHQQADALELGRLAQERLDREEERNHRRLEAEAERKKAAPPAPEPPRKTRAERMQEIAQEYEAEKALAEKLPEGDLKDTALSVAEGRMRRRMAELV
jgi:hypothetical protein